MGRRALLLSVSVAACASPSTGAPDPSPAPPPVTAAPPAPIAPAEPPPPVASTDPRCDRAPCAARPVVFVHGQGGSNSDGQSILDAMTSEGERWDRYTWLGTSDHAALETRAIPRRAWLFALDYYVRAGNDARGSYTAGPGRIGSDAAFPCTSPKGKGHLVADSPSYDDGVTHDYATDLASAVDDVLRATGASKVDIVAHSMGGLVTRSYLDFFGGNAKVERVMFLASPHLGVPFATLGSFFIGEPWMQSHELTELDQGSLFAKSKFSLCAAGDDRDAWSKKLLAFETATPLGPELHCMSGSSDPIVSYESAHHPQCKDHVVVEGADHTGVLHANETTNAVRALLGGTYTVTN